MAPTTRHPSPAAGGGNARVLHQREDPAGLLQLIAAAVHPDEGVEDHNIRLDP